ncbi:MAG: hypothetical protein LC745_06340, partial [Planctomycetia bacterium]|nr:hypothetical protein [Planctomycetia bacterium]
MVRPWGWMRLGLACAAALAAGPVRAESRGPAPTYHREVVRILQKQCQDCHRPGEVAPFGLLTYD